MWSLPSAVGQLLRELIDGVIAYFVVIKHFFLKAKAFSWFQFLIQEEVWFASGFRLLWLKQMV